MGMVNVGGGAQPVAGPPAALRGRTAGVYQRLLSRELAQADIALDGARPCDISVLDERFARAVVLHGSLGLGESYVNGWWTSGDLEEVIYRLLRSGLERKNHYRLGELRLAAWSHVTNRQSKRRSRRVARDHYDLGEQVFTFLGRYKSYSCGYFTDTTSLDQAQQRKLELLCRKLQLARGDRLLDVGGGWGEFARYAAEHYGARVTSINISDEQLRFAAQYCAGQDVSVVKCDYRDVTGTYDKIAAIAMLPHVGPPNYRRFLQVMHDRLAPDGLLLIESTGGNVSRAYCEPWTDKYIFRGGTIPSLTQIGAAIEGLFVLEDLHNFGPHYVPTLRAWHANFQAAWPELARVWDERMRRTFEYFFLSCAAAFRARDLQYWHLVLTKPGTPQPDCRR